MPVVVMGMHEVWCRMFASNTSKSCWQGCQMTSGNIVATTRCPCSKQSKGKLHNQQQACLHPAGWMISSIFSMF
jgi:hypothetical protein